MNELVKIEVSFEYAPSVYIYERETGWYWKFKLPNGKWFYGQAPGNNEQAVKRNADRKAKELAKGLFSQKEIDKIQRSSSRLTTFQIAIDEYIDHLKSEGASPNYYKDLKKRLLGIAKVLETKYRVKYVHKLTEDDAYNFRKHLLKRVKAEEIKRVTAFGALNDIKRLFKWLKRRKWIPQNPWLEVDSITVPKEERARTVTPPPEVLPKLMSANYKHRFEFPVKEFAYGLFRTGARKEELLYLEVDDVDWETGKWLIQPKKCPIQHGDRWAPKYSKARVTIIPQDVLEMLKPLVERANTHRVVGYSPNDHGRVVPVEAKFIFTMIDRDLSKGRKKKVYRRVDSVRGAWGALFVAAGLVEPAVCINESAKKYKNGQRLRTDVKVPFTRHDMRRGFNVAARDAGMSLDDRALILGHGREVNENNYCGKPEFKTDKIADIVNNKMWKELLKVKKTG